MYLINIEKKEEKDDDDDEFLNNLIKSNKVKEEEEKQNQAKNKAKDDLSEVYKIIGNDCQISKSRFQDNSVIRLLSDWKEGETRQT